MCSTDGAGHACCVIWHKRASALQATCCQVFAKYLHQYELIRLPILTMPLICNGTLILDINEVEHAPFFKIVGNPKSLSGLMSDQKDGTALRTSVHVGRPGWLMSWWNTATP